jgi:hypothetical protein
VLGAVAILTGALSVLSGAVLAGPVSATAACGKGELTSSTTCYYGTSGDVDDTFTPPAGVTDVTLTADGAPGGGAASAGGDGAQVTADIPVTPLTPGYVEVGTGGGTGTGGGLAGNGGGLSGIYSCAGCTGDAGDALVVAAGGGGGGIYVGGGAGGTAGTGACINPAGAGYSGGTAGGYYGGVGGTCTGGGANSNGLAGGGGGAGTGADSSRGGGGGGGYYGGGADVIDGVGGGGGSSFVESGAIGTPTFGANGSGTPSVTITWTAPTCSPSVGAVTCTIGGAASLTGGSLTIEAPGTLSWSTTLTGVDNSLDAPATLTPIDATGSGLGWATTVTSTTFTAGSETLLTTALTVNGSATLAGSTTAPMSSCVAMTTCTLPTSITSPVIYPLSVPAAATAPTPVNLYTADAATGIGGVNLASDWWLFVPGNAYAGDYTNTITLAIASGP